MPPNYRQQRGAPLQRHERRGLVFVVGALIAAGAGIGGWELSSGSATPTGQGKCVSVLLASSMGGVQIRHCGEAARRWCASEEAATGTLASEAQRACRREGFG